MEKDLAWNQRLRRERKRRGLTQAEVAAFVGSDNKSVGRWERGEAFPSPYNRRKLIELYEKNAEELGLFKEETNGNSETPEPIAGNVDGKIPAHHISWQDDWGEAPHSEGFYGREQERARVERWIVDDHCRVVAVLGIGGVGKTTFATVIAHQVRHNFDYVFWRSLQNAPRVESILHSFLRFVSSQRPMDIPEDLDGQISLLITSLREHRCLLILDNVESVLQPGHRAGLYTTEHEGYGRLFQRAGETEHQSALLLTSREKPGEIARMEGNSSRVRSLPLAGVELLAVQKLLADKALFGSNESWVNLVDHYAGNPLALKMISEPIREVFGGDIALFLKVEETVFGDVYDLLDRQFQRLTGLEQEIMWWLAIEREAVALDEIQANILHPVAKGALLEAFDSLRRRSMIEIRDEGRFTLQPVILEYVSARFVEQVHEEIAEESIKLFGNHALIKAQADDYVRDSQVRFILVPIATRLIRTFGEEESVKKLKRILSKLRMLQTHKGSYAAGNVLNLLIYLQADPRGFDFSDLKVRQAYLQGVMLPEVNFTSSDLSTSIFTSTFTSILCVTLSPNGELLAGGTTTGEVLLWQVDSFTPLFTCLGHADGVRSVAFSPDGRMLASGSEDQTVRFWDTSTGQCFNTLHGHTSLVRAIAFSPNGSVVASGSEDQTIRLWDTGTGQCLSILRGHTHWVRCVAFSMAGNILASGSDDTTIRMWDAKTGACLKTLCGHTSWVRCVAISPDESLLVSGSHDQTMRIWDLQSGQCLKTLHGHRSSVWSVAFSPLGNTVASGSDDGTTKLWDVDSGICIKTLRSDRPYERMNISNAVGLTEAQRTSLIMLGAIEDE